MRHGEGGQLNINRSLLSLLLFWQLISFSCAIFAQDNTRFVAIVMDDLGNNLPVGKELIHMPYDITYSFLPHTTYSLPLSKLALKHNKELMLHLPMQPLNNKVMGPGGLYDNMDHRHFLTTLRHDMKAIPGVNGINNHMGSLLTQNSQKMQWLMEELKSNKNLYFVDSKTHALSVAAKQARAYRVPNTSRDIFLDHVVNKIDIDYQFERLIKRIDKVGYALAIGHPHRETIKALKFWLPKLEKAGVRIVSVSHYIQLIESRRLLWQASLSRSRKVVKN